MKKLIVESRFYGANSLYNLVDLCVSVRDPVYTCMCVRTILVARCVHIGRLRHPCYSCSSSSSSSILKYLCPSECSQPAGNTLIFLSSSAAWIADLEDLIPTLYASMFTLALVLFYFLHSFILLHKMYVCTIAVLFSLTFILSLLYYLYIL